MVFQLEPVDDLKPKQETNTSIEAEGASSEAVKSPASSVKTGV